jgi:hypothetical protein
LAEAALRLEPGDRVSITEAVSGLNAAQFTIQRCNLTYVNSRVLWCEWGLVPAPQLPMWQWGIAGASEWGVHTYWGV